MTSRIVLNTYELNLCLNALIALSATPDPGFRATIIGFYTSLIACFDDVDGVRVLLSPYP